MTSLAALPCGNYGNWQFEEASTLMFFFFFFLFRVRLKNLIVFLVIECLDPIVFIYLFMFFFFFFVLGSI
jgi:hypothetical protein